MAKTLRWTFSRFADALVEAGGVQLLLGLPHNQHTHTGLSLAFFGLSSIPSAFDQLVSPLSVRRLNQKISIYSAVSVPKTKAHVSSQHTRLTTELCNPAVRAVRGYSTPGR